MPLPVQPPPSPAPSHPPITRHKPHNVTHEPPHPQRIPTAQSPGVAPASGLRARIPNALTTARVLVSLGVCVLLARTDWRLSPASSGAHDPQLLAAAGLFVAAALTDALDGFLARRWNALSTFGRVMDPFADKVLVLGTAVMLAGPGLAAVPLDAAAAPVPVVGLDAWMVVVLVARELLVTSIRAVLEARGVPFGADPAGKLKMILQSLGLPALLLLAGLGLLRTDTPPSAWHAAARAACWLIVAATALSGVPYVLRALRPMPENPRTPADHRHSTIK